MSREETILFWMDYFCVTREYAERLYNLGDVKPWEQKEISNILWGLVEFIYKLFMIAKQKDCNGNSKLNLAIKSIYQLT